MFIGQFLKGNKMLQSRLHNGGYYAHAKVLNAHNHCVILCVCEILMLITTD